ncbi:hypothetical protein OTERR_08410 [Oryzomicrobium terrae]|uniref:Uncharacterized protein n=1 Tax=Oryzomicrobium terrae TaxID=1735038 RepID=A0A5C1E7P8_9RHOO|nr:hypothetical protein OTERR_08410 [Oryzomicrobium terrae]
MRRRWLTEELLEIAALKRDGHAEHGHPLPTYPVQEVA